MTSSQRARGAGETGTMRLRAGFIPLLDAAPLIVAREMGFAADEAIDLELVRETSWANIRDRMFLGHFDAAHMLAPMAVSTRLGIGHVQAPLIATWVLNHGGNSIAITPALKAEGGEWGAPGDPIASGRTLARIVASRARANREPLTLATVFPFSCHHYQVCHWLDAAGIDPDRDVRLVVVPPPHIVEAMMAGSVDVVCVGAPWTSLAVEAGVGHLLMPAAALWPSAPEKVLAVREDFAASHAAEFTALLRAVDQAAAWCEDVANRKALAALLARPEFVGVDAQVIEAALEGFLPVGLGETPMRIDGFLRFHGTGATGSINRPRVADGLWFAAQMLRRRQYADRHTAFEAARAVFLPTIWDETFGSPTSSSTEVTTFFGPIFNASEPEAWLSRMSAAAV